MSRLPWIPLALGLTAFAPGLAQAQATAAFTQACESGVVNTYGMQRNNSAACSGPSVSNAGETKSATLWAQATAVATGFTTLNTYSNAVHADLLVFDAPDASPENPVTVTMGYKFNGQVSKRGGLSTATVYIGAAADFSCRTNDWEAFGLPLAQNLSRQLANATHLHGTPKRVSGDITVVVTTPQVVMPVMVCSHAEATPPSSKDGVGFLPADAQAAMSLTLSLPAGVSCRSRTGNAFKGQCGPLVD